MVFELHLAGLVDFRPDMLKEEKGSASTVPISIDLVIFPVVFTTQNNKNENLVDQQVYWITGLIPLN